MPRLSCLFVLALGFTTLGFAQSTANCKVTYISQPGNSYALMPQGINQYGTIVGYSNAAKPKAFIRYSDGTFGTITVAGASGVVPMRRNSAGTTGGYFTLNGVDHGFANANGKTVTVDFPNSRSTRVNGINKYGTMVGSRILKGESSTGSFELKSGKFTDFPAFYRILESINDSGLMVGLAQTRGDEYGISQTSPTAQQKSIEYPNTTGTEIADVNNAGIMVGNYQGLNDTSTNGAFLYNSTTKVFMNFVVPSASGVVLNGINGANTVTGYASFPKSGGGTTNRGFYAACTL